MIIDILKTIVTFIVLIFVGTNLIGMTFRGFIALFSFQKTGNVGVDYLMKSHKRSAIFSFSISVLITLGFLYVLYYYFNYLLSIAALMIMLSRLPDLVIEIQTGEKISKRNMTNRPIDLVFNIINWLALPVIYYSFHYYGI